MQNEKKNIKKNEREFKKHFEGITERVKGSKKSEILWSHFGENIKVE